MSDATQVCSGDPVARRLRPERRRTMHDRLTRYGFVAVATLAAAVGTGTVATSVGTDVTTYHNDNARTGQNLTETALSSANVRSTGFGKIALVTLDGKVDAQPLYLSGLNIAGRGARDVLYAATEHGTVYAIDAASL